MAGKGSLWGWIGRSVSWEDVARQAPRIVKAAQVLYEQNRQRQRAADPREAGTAAAGTDLSPRIADLEDQVRRLQENETQQAALVNEMAGELERVVQSLDALGARVRLLSWLAGGALLVAAVTLVLAL